MIKECLSKLEIKLLKLSYIRISFLVSLVFVPVINPYSVLNLIFLNILVCLLYIVYLYKYITEF